MLFSTLDKKKRLLISSLVMLFLIADKYFLTLNLPFYLIFIITLCGYLFIAADVIVSAFKTLFKQFRMTEQFLMMIATIGAFCLQDFPEALAVMVFYKVGQLFEDYAQSRSHNEISSLVSLKPSKVRLIDENGNESTVKPRQVKIGDIIRVLPGESVSIDGYLVEESAAIDTKAITGESEPRLYKKGESVPSGCINQGSVITLKVNTLSKNSSITRLLNLIEDAASAKSTPETLITRFAKWYTPIVVFCALLMALVPVFVHSALFSDWIERSLIFLVVSCPCALVLSVPLSFFGGLGAISKLGVMVKGTVHLETMAHVKAIAFDKTGTLTKGKFNVVNVVNKNISKEELLKIALSLESLSTHPVALSITAYAMENNIEKAEFTDIKEFSGLGLKGLYEGKCVAVGKASFIKSITGDDELYDVNTASTTVYVSSDNALCGYIELFDEVKDNAVISLQKLKSSGFKTSLISGDREAVVKKVADTLSLDEYSSMQTPEDKVATFNEFKERTHQKEKGYCAYVGDGLNDAPVISLADVGICMGNIGSAGTVEASDVVIMNDNLLSLVKAFELSKRTYNLAMSNLVFVMTVKFMILISGALGFASIWLAIFGDVGVLILAVLNAMRAAMRALRFK